MGIVGFFFGGGGHVPQFCSLLEMLTQVSLLDGTPKLDGEWELALPQVQIFISDGTSVKVLS